MLNYFKFIEILVSLQFIILSTMIPVLVAISFTSKFKYILDFPITWQIPSIILITLIFRAQVVFKAFSIYLLLGLFIVPIFHNGGSLGYLLTPNFGYLIGIYPLIRIIDNLNKRNKIYFLDFLKSGILAIFAMHIIGILYNCIQMLYYKQINIFLYNIGNYSIGKIGYHILMLLPLSLLMKPINYFKRRN